MPLPPRTEVLGQASGVGCGKPDGDGHLPRVQPDDAACRCCRRRAPVKRRRVKAASPQFWLVLTAGERQPLKDLQSDADRSYQIGAIGTRGTRFLGHCQRGRQDAGRRVRKAGVVEIQQMGEGAVSPRGGHRAGTQVAAEHARLGRAALLARDIEDDAPRRFDRRGEPDTGTIKDVPLGCRDRLGTDVGDASPAGEFGKYCRCSHVMTPCGVLDTGFVPVRWEFADIIASCPIRAAISACRRIGLSFDPDIGGLDDF